jgi:hypothetical protein
MRHVKLFVGSNPTATAMDTTIDILDTVLLNFRIEDGQFLANLGDEVVNVEELVRVGNGDVWVTYWKDDELVTVQKYEARRSDMTKRAW